MNKEVKNASRPKGVLVTRQRKLPTIATADYSFSIGHYGEISCIIIEDKDLGGKTVTNDIENVVHDISIDEILNPEEYTIVYKDSMGYWDGYDAKNSVIVPLREKEWIKAVEKYLKRVK
jgi:hypothetical protein